VSIMNTPTLKDLQRVTGQQDADFHKYVSDICKEHPAGAVCDDAYILELWQEWKM
jgi:hypothetical protein